MERCYNDHVMDTATQEKKKALQEKPGPKPSLSSKHSGLKNKGRGETLKIHLKKMAPGQVWTQVPPKDKGPDIRKRYEPPRCQDSMGASQAGGSQMGVSQAGRSPLRDELFALGEDLMTVLDYQYDAQEDPELVQAIAHIPPRADMVVVEMEDVNAAPGFEPEFSHSGYDVNLVQHQITLRWAQFPQLWHKKVRCWMRNQCK